MVLRNHIETAFEICKKIYYLKFDAILAGCCSYEHQVEVSKLTGEVKALKLTEAENASVTELMQEFVASRKQGS